MREQLLLYLITHTQYFAFVRKSVINVTILIFIDAKSVCSVDLCQEMHDFRYYFIIILAAVCGNNYLCNVFFIVLDLRLTKRLDYGGSPFFMSI